MEELVIDILKNGKVEALHMDEFDLGFLGDKKISRASEIKFNSETQRWDIILPDRVVPESPDVTGFSAYDEARLFEVLWLQGCRKAGVKPYVAEGWNIASNIRNAGKMPS